MSDKEKHKLKERFIYNLRDKTAEMLLDLKDEFKDEDGFDEKWLNLVVDQYNQEYRKIKNLLLYFPEFK